VSLSCREQSSLSRLGTDIPGIACGAGRMVTVQHQTPMDRRDARSHNPGRCCEPSPGLISSGREASASATARDRPHIRDRFQTLHLGRQLGKLLLEVRRLRSEGFRWVLQIGGVELAQIPGSEAEIQTETLPQRTG
jgi:hypothetical protein